MHRRCCEANPLYGSRHRLLQALADVQAHVPLRLGIGTRCIPATVVRLPVDAETSQISSHDELEPSLSQVQETHLWLRADTTELAMGERYHVHRSGGRLLLSAYSDGYLLAQDRGLALL